MSILQAKKASKDKETVFSFKLSKVFPFFILFFLGASIMTTAAVSLGVPATLFHPVKDLSKFFIIWAMAAVGLNTDIIRLFKTGAKPLLPGFCCWCGITAVSLSMQHILGIW